MRNSTVCYIEKDGCYLMLHRVKKENDINRDKWIGIGGGFEEGESPEECIIREVAEETGLMLKKPAYRGIVTFVDGDYTEYMHLFHAKSFSGTLTDCDEGVLEWVETDSLASLELWEGDYIFLDLLKTDEPFFSLKLVYAGGKLRDAVLNGEKVKLPYKKDKKVKKSKKEVEIYTDGSCRVNPGPGGWGAVLVLGEHELEISGGEPETTNNRMELTSVIEAPSRLKEPCRVTLTSDSKYVCDGMTKGWAMSWREKGWKKSDGKAALNPDLWEKLLALCEKHEVTFRWVKGHAGHPYNERCDAMAQTESGKYL